MYLLGCNSGFHSWNGDCGNLKGPKFKREKTSPAMALNRLGKTLTDSKGHNKQQKKIQQKRLRLLEYEHMLTNHGQASVVPCPHHRKLNCKFVKLLVFGAISSKNKWFSPAALEPTEVTNSPPKMTSRLWDIMAPGAMPWWFHFLDGLWVKELAQKHWILGHLYCSSITQKQKKPLVF